MINRNTGITRRTAMTPATKSSVYFPPLLFIALSNFLHPASQHTPSESTIMLPRKKRKKTRFICQEAYPLKYNSEHPLKYNSEHSSFM